MPDFGDRFWTLPVSDARTDQISELGLQYGTKPGFYMLVGPSWKGETPPGITCVIRSSTDYAVTMPDRGSEFGKIVRPVGPLTSLSAHWGG
jgi:hypothetical protein